MNPFARTDLSHPLFDREGAKRVSCPACKTALEIPDMAEGKHFQCPECQTKFTIAFGIPVKLPKKRMVALVDPKAGFPAKAFASCGILRLFRESPASIKMAVLLGMGYIALLLYFLYSVIMRYTRALARLKVEVSASEYASRAQWAHWIVFGRITPTVLCILAFLLVLVCHILRGRNWTRVFVFSCFILTVSPLLFCRMWNVDLTYIACILGIPLLLGTALLFSKGANQWFGSFPRGLSYWPLVLPIVWLSFLLTTTR